MGGLNNTLSEEYGFEVIDKHNFPDRYEGLLLFLNDNHNLFKSHESVEGLIDINVLYDETDFGIVKICFY